MARLARYSTALQDPGIADTYEEKERVRLIGNQNMPTTHNGWRVVFVITKTGLPPIKTSQDAWHSQECGRFFDNLIDVHYHIVHYSQVHRPRVVVENQKVKRVVGTEEYEDV